MTKLDSASKNKKGHAVKVRKSKKVKEVIAVPSEPIKHVLVPKVEIASTQDLNVLKEQFGITRDKLPLIKQDDIAIAYLRATPGDVVKFIRKSLTTGENSAYYRLVIAAVE